MLKNIVLAMNVYEIWLMKHYFVFLEDLTKKEYLKGIEGKDN